MPHENHELIKKGIIELEQWHVRLERDLSQKAQLDKCNKLLKDLELAKARSKNWDENTPQRLEDHKKRLEKLEKKQIENKSDFIDPETSNECQRIKISIKAMTHIEQTLKETDEFLKSLCLYDDTSPKVNTQNYAKQSVIHNPNLSSDKKSQPTSPILKHGKFYEKAEYAETVNTAGYFSAYTRFCGFLKHLLFWINTPWGKSLTYPISAAIQAVKFAACGWDYYHTSEEERTSAKKIEFGIEGVSTGLLIAASILNLPILAMTAVVTTYVIPALWAASLLATIVTDVKNLLSHRKTYLDEEDPEKKQEYRDIYHKEITKTIVKGVIKLGTAAGIMVMLAFNMSVIATAATLAIVAITNHAVISGSGKLHEKIASVSSTITTFFKNKSSSTSSNQYDKSLSFTIQ